MKDDFIEKRVAGLKSLRKEHGPAYSMAQRENHLIWDGYNRALEDMESEFTTALQEALLKGLEMAEGAVRENSHQQNDDTVWCNLDETLTHIAALKKEVMEGTEGV